MNTEKRVPSNDRRRFGRVVSVGLGAVVCAAAFTASFWRHPGKIEVATATASTGDASRGKALAQRLNCYGCHLIGKPEANHYAMHPPTGPDLRSIASKLTPALAYTQIHDPAVANPHTLMPHYYGLSNNDDATARAVGEQEVHAMVHYLFANSVKQDVQEPPSGGRAENGKSLFNTKGCAGCHSVETAATNAADIAAKFPAVYGGNLSSISERTTPAWIFSFVKAPKRFAPDTLMPDLGLSDSEAADLTAYLTQQPKRQLPAPPPIDDVTMDDLAFDYLSKTTYESESIRQIDSWSSDEKRYYMGFRLLRRYGCYGCHRIKGFDDAPPNGTDLGRWKESKVIVLSYGVIDMPLDHYHAARAKLADPRVFERDLVFEPYDRLIMPKFALQDGEIEDLAAFVTSSETP